jgi:hypothetical protein
MRVSLKKIIVPSIPLAVFLVMVSCGLWILSFFADRVGDYSNLNSSLSLGVQNYISPNPLISNIICILITLINAFLLVQLNNRFTVIRTRTFLPILIFLMLMSTWSKTHSAIVSQLSLTFFIFAIFYFFRMARDKKASEQAFMGSLLISTTSIFLNPFIFIIPICWIGFMLFQSLSLRTFLASILGTLAPWIIYLSASYLVSPGFDLSQSFYIPVPSYDLNLSLFNIAEIIYSISLVIIFLISIVGLYSLTHGDAIHTRNKLNFLVFLIFSLFILSIIFRNQFVSFLPLIALVYSILISHPLTLKQNNFYGIIFLIFCILNIAFIISKYFLT